MKNVSGEDVNFPFISSSEDTVTYKDQLISCSTNSDLIMSSLRCPLCVTCALWCNDLLAASAGENAAADCASAAVKLIVEITKTCYSAVCFNIKAKNLSQRCESEISSRGVVLVVGGGGRPSNRSEGQEAEVRKDFLWRDIWWIIQSVKVILTWCGVSMLCLKTVSRPLTSDMFHQMVCLGR